MKSVPVRQVTWPTALSKNYTSNSPVAPFLCPVKANVYTAMDVSRQMTPSTLTAFLVHSLHFNNWLIFSACVAWDGFSYCLMWCHAAWGEAESCVVSAAFSSEFRVFWQAPPSSTPAKVEVLSANSYVYERELLLRHLIMFKLPAWSLVGESRISWHAPPSSTPGKAKVLSAN